MYKYLLAFLFLFSLVGCQTVEPPFPYETASPTSDACRRPIVSDGTDTYYSWRVIYSSINITYGNDKKVAVITAENGEISIEGGQRNQMEKCILRSVLLKAKDGTYFGPIFFWFDGNFVYIEATNATREFILPAITPDKIG